MRPAGDMTVRRRVATITAVDTATRTATVQWADGATTTAGVPYLSSYLPVVGGVALVDLLAGSPLIVGSSASSRHGCRLRRAANQSVTATTATSLSWDTEDQDTDGYAAVTGATVTIPAGLGGLYAITAHAIGNTISGATRAYIDILPTTAITGTPANLRATAFPTENRYLATPTLQLLAGDTFVVQVFYTGVAGPVNHTAWLSCYRIGD